MIAEALAGKRIAVTGSTGFLGTALVERLLRGAPECQLVLLVRPPRRGDVQRRVDREILKNDAFDRLREEWGDQFDSICAGRIQVVAGDVGTDGLGLNDEDRATFASCDIVIHSATKYLAGHSEVNAGLVVVKDDGLGKRVYFAQNRLGGVLAPNECDSVRRGIQTLALRMDRQQENARAISSYLLLHPLVKSVHYPGLSGHEYEIWTLFRKLRMR